ncbi:peptidase inhibitor family I36 protein [Cellulomonas sp. NPDC089187]|uniref:peptidase inhibitor family I36 protein n=1 Tax=Cellulomonas sp. NPDC089187 TaxID=3154970 RepID=UPI003440D670
MSSRHLLRRRLTTLALAAGLLIAVPPTAGAQEDPIGGGPVVLSASQCAAGRFCLWSGAGYTGAFWSTGSAGVQSSQVSIARTVWNRTGVAVRLYSGSGATGTWICVNSGGLYTSTSMPSTSIRTMTTAIC